VSEVSVSQFSIIAMSLIMSWILDDGVANLLLKKYQKGAKIRFVGARWLSRKNAIIVTVIEITVAMIFGYYIQDFLTNLYTQAFAYIVPITLFTIGVLYPYLLAGLPYKVKLKHILPSIILILLALLLFAGIRYVTNNFSF
jgi:hypothetical protein